MSTRNGTATPTTQRKTLASQIDRLDLILDGFSDALDESVADQVRNTVHQAVGSAVQKTLSGLLTDPAQMKLLFDHVVNSAKRERKDQRRQLWQQRMCNAKSFANGIWQATKAGFLKVGTTIKQGSTGVFTTIWQWRFAATRLITVVCLVLLLSMVLGALGATILATVSAGILSMLIPLPRQARDQHLDESEILAYPESSGLTFSESSHFRNAG